MCPRGNRKMGAWHDTHFCELDTRFGKAMTKRIMDRFLEDWTTDTAVQISWIREDLRDYRSYAAATGFTSLHDCRPARADGCLKHPAIATCRNASDSLSRSDGPE